MASKGQLILKKVTKNMSRLPISRLLYMGAGGQQIRSPKFYFTIFKICLNAGPLATCSNSYKSRFCPCYAGSGSLHFVEANFFVLRCS
jgi:hypothetical protein